MDEKELQHWKTVAVSDTISGLFRFSHQCDEEDWKKVRVIRDTLEFIAKRVKEEKLDGSS